MTVANSPLMTVTEAPRKMLSERQILDLIPVARSTLQQWEKAGNFPKSIMIGPNRKAWFADEIAKWQEAKAA
jgi:prophage regulatory protein